MEIESFIKKMKDINSSLLDFIEESDDLDKCDAKFKTLIQLLEKQEVFRNKKEMQLIFQIISKITDNHHRPPDFFNKLEKLFQFLIKDSPSPISYFIPDYTNYNKPVVFLLLQKKLLKPDKPFLNEYLENKQFIHPRSNKNLFEYRSYYYLYPVIKEFLEEKIQKEIEEVILNHFEEELSTFEEKCKIGENDSYICSLIRLDSVEEFIAYVNRTNLSLLTKIKPSIYETHSFLIDKEPTLIEYAAFFGSIQIIQYLKYNNVPLTSSMWVYAIHSNKEELIHFLEENRVKPEKNIYNYYTKTIESYDDVIIESIKCHHNGISNYIKYNFYKIINLNDEPQFYDKYSGTIFNSLNFIFFPDEVTYIICNTRKEEGFKLSQLCFSLTTITITSSVTSIRKYAFFWMFIIDTNNNSFFCNFNWRLCFL